MEVLLIGAVAMIAMLILTAWLMTFAKWFPLPGVDDFVVDYNTMIRGHVDYALMALFSLGFYGAAKGGGLDLPVAACWAVAIGGFTNPTIFIVAAFDMEFWDKVIWKIFSAVSFAITTFGFVWIGFTFLQFAW